MENNENNIQNLNNKGVNNNQFVLNANYNNSKKPTKRPSNKWIILVITLVFIVLGALVYLIFNKIKLGNNNEQDLKDNIEVTYFNFEDAKEKEVYILKDENNNIYTYDLETNRYAEESLNKNKKYILINKYTCSNNDCTLFIPSAGETRYSYEFVFEKYNTVVIKDGTYVLYDYAENKVLNYYDSIAFLYDNNLCDTSCEDANDINYAIVIKNNKYGIISLDGSVTLPIEYEEISTKGILYDSAFKISHIRHTSQGLSEYTYYEEPNLIVYKNGKYGIYNFKDKKFAIEMSDNEIIYNEGQFYINTNGIWTCYDAKVNQIFSGKYTNIISVYKDYNVAFILDNGVIKAVDLNSNELDYVKDHKINNYWESQDVYTNVSITSKISSDKKYIVLDSRNYQDYYNLYTNKFEKSVSY